MIAMISDAFHDVIVSTVQCFVDLTCKFQIFLSVFKFV